MTTGLRKLNKISEKYRDLLEEEINNHTLKLEEVNYCVSCDNELFEKLLEVDRFNLPFGSYICQKCGLVTTSPRLQEKSLPYYYEKYYHPLNYGKEDLSEQVALFAEGQGKKIYHKLQKYFKNKTKLNVLEIGAGVGNVLDEFRTEAYNNNIEVNLLATEYSTECILECEKKGITSIMGNAESVLDMNKKFDIIILSHVFEHFINLKNELLIFKQLLSNNGLLYIEVPGILKNHNKIYYDFSFLGYSVHAHMYNFSLTTLQNSITKYGFKLEEGNEEVEAIFTLTTNDQYFPTNDYLRIKYYLYFLEDSQYFSLSQDKKINILTNTVSKIKKEIKNREKELTKISTQLKNREKELTKISTQLKNRNNEVIYHKKTIRKIGKTTDSLIKIPLFKNPIKKYKAYKQLVKVINANKS